MVIAGLIIVVLIGLGGAIVVFGLRRVFLEEEDAEARVRTSEAHVLEYAIPPGVDPADLRAAVATAGFTGAVKAGPSGDRLRVVCAEHDRARLRDAIEGAHSAASGDAPLRLGPVAFVYERPA
jgi:hypothetical protein